MGEQLESIIDFIKDTFGSICSAIKNLFTQNEGLTLADIEGFIDRIGGLLKQGAQGAKDFYQNHSRYQFAYWAGIGVFEVAINILLLALTGGLGNIAKAETTLAKLWQGLKIFGREAFSVATFGIVDLLAMLRRLIIAFGKACEKGIKGFLRWVEEMMGGGKGKNIGSATDEIVGMAERIKTTKNAEEFLASAKRLENIKPEEALKYLDEALVHFNHEVVDGVVVQISDTNCAIVVQKVDEFLRTGKISKAIKSGYWDIYELENVYDKTFKTISISSLEKVLKNGEKAIIAGIRSFPKKGHVFNVIKIEGKLKFVDGQTGQFANINNGYEYFKYLKTI